MKHRLPTRFCAPEVLPFPWSSGAHVHHPSPPGPENLSCQDPTVHRTHLLVVIVPAQPPRVNICSSSSAGSLGVPLHWSMKSESRAVCLRFAPPTAGSGEGSPWSHPLEASFPGGTDRHVAIPVQPPTPSETAKPGLRPSYRF